MSRKEEIRHCAGGIKLNRQSWRVGAAIRPEMAEGRARPFNDVWKGRAASTTRAAARPHGPTKTQRLVDQCPEQRRPRRHAPAVGNPPLLVQPLKLFRRHSEIQPNQMGSVNFLL
jgi:hypothetical protein